ncbi:hypothetical protein A2384_06820 [Candidatus Peribacteria bacterium RIFOXYB1_FULL_54_35]|nr:MAG: hypothetical protein A2384_06820 [Candidatus Peribacteria bacterium RIFOXYB1_FULL_54_35]
MNPRTKNPRTKNHRTKNHRTKNRRNYFLRTDLHMKIRLQTHTHMLHKYLRRMHRHRLRYSHLRRNMLVSQRRKNRDLPRKDQGRYYTHRYHRNTSPAPHIPRHTHL